MFLKKVGRLRKNRIFAPYLSTRKVEILKLQIMNSIYPTLSFILLLGLHATPSFSQNDDFVKQFQQSRQAMLDDYNKFRNTILTDYDKYMQGVWKEYKKFKGDVRS